jgi:hypothetical protein
MSTVIIFQGLAGTLWDGEAPTPGQYLREYDHEYAGGLGWADWTSDPTKALTFDSPAEALRVWRSQSRTRPVRVDGQPNRPLTAYTVEIGEIP